MNAGFIVGYITQPNGMPVSDAEIWFGATNAKDSFNQKETNEIGEKDSRQPVAKTDSRGYFQLPIVCFGASVGEVVGTNGRLNIFVGSPNNAAAESAASRLDENFQVTGYLVKDAAEANV